MTDTIIADTPAKQLLFTTVRIVNRSARGEGYGTGFIVNGSRDATKVAPVVVTNKHVFEGASELDLQMIKKHATEDRPMLGERVSATLTDPDQFWIGHPDPTVDVAVAPLAAVLAALPAPVFFRALPSDLMPSAAVAADLDAIEEVTFVGYPNGHYDEQHLTPIVRRGITATPISLPFGGRPVFLLDGSVFGGSSGSPVFIYNDGMFRQGTNIMMGQTRVLLVGVIAETMVREKALPLKAAAPYVEFAQELNLGVVFTWHAIDAALDELFSRAGQTR